MHVDFTAIGRIRMDIYKSCSFDSLNSAVQGSRDRLLVHGAKVAVVCCEQGRSC
jgi:hypothetical protein